MTMSAMVQRAGRAAAATLPRAGVILLALTLGCGDVLDLTDPDIIDPDNVNTPAGAVALHAGAVGEWSFAIVGDAGGQEGIILVGGLMSDEYVHSGTFPTRLEFEQRKIDERNGTLTGVFRQLQRARYLTEAAIPRLRQYAPTPLARIGEMWALSGLSYVFVAETYCSGTPFSNLETYEFGMPLTTTEMLDTALARFDSALVDSGTAAIANLARVGRGRALLNQGQFAAAAAAVAGVPTAYSFVTTHTTTSGRQQNGVHVFNWLSERWSVADVEGGNGLNFRGAADPRVQSVRDPTGAGVGFDNSTPQYNLLKYPTRTTSVPIATGIEARLIEAEAVMVSAPATWLGILNTLRQTAITPPLADLVDPGTAAGREDLMFRERAFWLYATGHRLGDLRRLMRQYGRAEDAVFPTGLHFKGDNYGDDVNVPVPFNERNNPNFTGCFDRNP
jgi:hypothetical protein